MKILVTGGAGFIGSHVAEGYLKEGHQVVVVDDLSTGKREQVPAGAVFYKLDVRSDGLEAVFERERPDVVNHHAAQKSVPKSVACPSLDADVNVAGTLRLLDLCIRYGTGRFIFASTGGALAGEETEIPTPEEARPALQSPYAISKYTVEQYLRFYRRTHGLEFVALRYANVYGPRQAPEGECGAVPIFMHNLAAGQPSTLFTAPEQPLGTTRDYVYVEDVCRANLAALQAGDGEVLNIGSGEERYMAEIYDLVSRAMGRRENLILAGSRPGDLLRSALDCSKARQLLGWRAEISLEEGLERTARWLLEETASSPRIAG
ncbi:NAD-dependent epimerase/dehydratase family protein [Gorillibacterium sp. sgz5001074]|uniref:NAD-dependent epimerase/dehydratase family protein n=1 Tax=Gorillibacterium sp. sgz5001074 TaxID=3446695 RepID=UPI003F67A5C4